MAMRQDGRMAGTLSGGCLEGDLFLHAETVMSTQASRIYTYDLSEDDMWGLGIGCKGTVSIWLEPVRVDAPFWQAFGQAIQRQSTVLWGGALPEGRRFLVSADDHMGEVPSWASSMLTTIGSSDTGTREGLWWDRMRSPERLVIAGAGHDAEPVARLGNLVGFDVIVLDPRPHVNNEEHFPHAEHWVMSATEVNPEKVSGAFWVIMNHHQRRDEAAIQLAALARPRFVGILGPLKRTEEMLNNLGIAQEDVPIHAPVGLDIGADSPEEVAVSIIGELMAARRGTRGGSLHGRAHIHRS